MRRSRTTASALAGLLLSTTLAACGNHPPVQTATPEPVVVVRTVRDTPPADLTVCPAAVQGLPVTGEAVIPLAWRNAIARIARTLGARTDQLTRLITWTTGTPCPGTSPEGADR